MNHRPRLTHLLVLAAFVVAACSGAAASGSPGASGSPSTSPSPAGPTPVGTAPQGLDGRTFLSTDIDGRALLPGSQVRISFQGGQISASGGCNSMSGPYSIDADHLVARSLATTEMACAPPVMAQDTWLADLLDGAAIDLDGTTLTLSKGGVTLTLEDREVADPDRPLLGTRWVVDGIISGDAVSSVPIGVTAALTFSEGNVDVEAGCNRGGGSVQVDEAGGTITFGPIALTKMACEPPAMAVEQAIGAVLAGSVAYTIEAGSLTLNAGGGGLLLRAAD
ncbi:MAG: META domain-containing protein [Chloroflexota bacterium]